MKLASARFISFKRFSNLEIANLSDTLKLVVLLGPNGCGKSSVFDGFRTWQGINGGPQANYDPLYQQKFGAEAVAFNEQVKLTFHAEHEARKAFSIRTAYRNEPDFIITSVSRLGNMLDMQRITRMIDNDASVSENFQRLVSLTVSSLFDESNDSLAVKTLRERLFGELQQSFTNLFGDIRIPTLRDPLTQGTFTFDKGISRGFQYKNLSGGEKAAFDIVLDLIVKRTSYDDTIYCIDEPEVHLGTRLQGTLLYEMMRLIPDDCQLWIATHSIGMLNAAKSIAASEAGSVAFLDFGSRNFDAAIRVEPEVVSRDFWLRSLSVSLDDLAGLISPARLVLCEGNPTGSRGSRAEFDARCLREIFRREFADTDFLSVGSSGDVQRDKLGLGRSFATILPATEIIRVIDRDELTASEVASFEASGVRVLSRRNLESFLLDDEILIRFVTAKGRPDLAESVLAAKKHCVDVSVQQGHGSDDMKSIAGLLLVELRRLIGLTQSGSTADVFMLESLTPHITPATNAYAELRNDIFKY